MPLNTRNLTVKISVTVLSLLLIVTSVFPNDKKNLDTLRSVEAALPFIENDRMGYADTSGNVVISPRFLFAGSYSEEIAYVKFTDGSSGLIKRDGEIVLILKDEYSDNIEAMSTKMRDFFEVQNGYLIVRLNSGKFTYMSKDGPLLNEYGFDWVEPISEGMGAFCNDCSMGHWGGINGGRWGFVGIHGEVVITADYEKVSKFKEGLAAAKINGHWGLLQLLNLAPELLADALPLHFKPGGIPFGVGLHIGV